MDVTNGGAVEYSVVTTSQSEYYCVPEVSPWEDRVYGS